MELVDSHCHIDFEPLASQLPEVLLQAQRNQVAYLLCVSVNLEDFPRVQALARTYREVFASVGIHPNERDGREATVDELIGLADDPDIVAIGETGLDYFRSTGDVEWQRERFRRHIEAAVQSHKPLIVHSRAAPDDTISILREGGADKAGGVMHCFAEDWRVARQALDLGLYISFSGIVTFKNAEPIKDVARKAPLDRILVETDSPYLAPVPFRGKTNQPAYVKHTAEYVAKLRGTSLEDLAVATTANFFALFRDAYRLTN
ncbi:MAG: TatD family hydrolase [Gammaproteobacteria bacterium]|nr:TatD family hydrolase [Gammaproteobacteria bacterium]